ncbi:hypothetical protein ACIOMM_34860 [Streptomyces sp. NPDC087908]|uniref:hypothetical protein n=1 Tax=Streptomyces sp. NPDC087908 TaxID=3365820 RepID=UPI0037F104FC
MVKRDFLAVIESRLTGRPDYSARGMEKVGRIIFDVCDIDRNGFMDDRDYCRFLFSYGVPEQDALWAVRRITSSANPILSRSRFIELSREFYCSADPDAAGNWMFGKF